MSNTTVYKSNREQKKEAAQKILKWINDHDCFKWVTMCKRLDIDPSNFSKKLSDPEAILQPDAIAKITKFIKEYGFK
jgi:hypothetical protein